jgi:hypothetical protein
VLALHAAEGRGGVWIERSFLSGAAWVSQPLALLGESAMQGHEGNAVRVVACGPQSEEESLEGEGDDGEEEEEGDVWDPSQATPLRPRCRSTSAASSSSTAGLTSAGRLAQVTAADERSLLGPRCHPTHTCCSVRFGRGDLRSPVEKRNAAQPPTALLEKRLRCSLTSVKPI